MTSDGKIDAMVVALAWYAREDYPAVLEVMRDAKDLHETFDEWEESARNVEDTLRKRGFSLIRVMIKPGEFLEWCSVLGFPPNAKARSKFANNMARLRGENAKDGDVIG